MNNSYMVSCIKKEEIDEECNIRLGSEMCAIMETNDTTPIYAKIETSNIVSMCETLETNETPPNYKNVETNKMVTICATMETNECAPTRVIIETSKISKHSNGKPKREFVCNECKKVYTTKQALERHHISHTNVSRFMCDACGYAAISQAYLDVHVRSKHTLERPFKCPECDFTCPSKGQLQGHLKTHSQDKKYRCAMCDYGTHTKPQLVRHVKLLHTNDRDWPCPLCSKSFVDKYTLKGHIVSHTTEQPFQCPLCHTSFKENKSRLLHHKRFHTEGGKQRIRRRR